MQTVSIYKVTNLINGKQYVGKSKDVNTRWDKHKWLAHTNRYYLNNPLYQDIREYGDNNFELSVLETREFNHYTDKEANELEQHYIHSIPSELRYNRMVKGVTKNNSLCPEKQSKSVVATLIRTGEETVYPSIYAACMDLFNDKNNGNVGNVLSGKKKSCKGYHFKYLNN